MNAAANFTSITTLGAVNVTQTPRLRMKREISRDLGGAELERISRPIFIEGDDYSFVNYSLFCLFSNLFKNHFIML